MVVMVLVKGVVVFEVLMVRIGMDRGCGDGRDGVGEGGGGFGSVDGEGGDG